MRIVAIEGEEIGRPGYPVELTAIDAEVVRLTGKRRPLVVFLPTATQDDPVYVRAVEEHYGGHLVDRSGTIRNLLPHDDLRPLTRLS